MAKETTTKLVRVKVGVHADIAELAKDMSMSQSAVIAIAIDMLKRERR